MSNKSVINKKTQEEAQKEMEELTKVELQKLAETISKNPELLKPKFMDSDSESDSDYNSDSDSNASSVTNYHNKSLTVYKKELEIDKLQEKQYYKTLEITNLICENSKLKNDLKEVKSQNDESIKFIDFVKKIIQLKEKNIFSNELINFNQDIKTISTNMLTIQKEYETAIDDINKLKTLIDNQENLIKNYFGKEISLIENNVQNIYQKNFDLLNKKLEQIDRDKKIDFMLFIMVFLYLVYMVYVRWTPENISNLTFLVNTFMIDCKLYILKIYNDLNKFKIHKKM
jgi:hypothetical protein